MTHLDDSLVGGGIEISTPQALSRILGTSHMQALLGLSRREFVDMSYYTTAGNMVDLSSRYQREDFDPGTGKLLNYGARLRGEEASNKGFYADVRMLETQIESWDEIRELYYANFLTSEAIRYLFAAMAENNKINHTQLSLKDKNMFGYNDMEMSSFIQYGIALQAFGDFRTQVADTLDISV